MDDLTGTLRKMMSDRKSKMIFDNIKQKSFDEGTLGYCVMNGKKRIYQIKYENGKRRRITITNDFKKQILIAKHTLIAKQIDDYKYEVDVLERAIKKIEKNTCNDYYRFISDLYSWMNREMIENIVRDHSVDDEWANEKFEQSTYKVEEKTKMTSRGLRVRSKSEMLIAEKLYEFGLPFRYEEMVDANGYQLAPDFTIKRSDGKLFYWEHEGMTSVKSYLDRQRRKADLYASIGIVPWDNFIVTYDNENGDIDLRIVEAEIRNKLLL